VKSGSEALGRYSSAFQALVHCVEECEVCPRMEGRARVLGSANGPERAKVLFIAEAPGRLGAERSRIPLHGDQTGRNFEALLASVKLKRREVFITNAVLCNPQDEFGRAMPRRRARRF
jgi:uracil-DNA glycosylase